MSSNSIIKGTVKATEGQDLPGVVVTLNSSNLQVEHTTVTSANGKYDFRNLPTGAFTIEAVMSGFRPAKETVEVEFGQTRTVNLIMSPSSGEE